MLLTFDALNAFPIRCLLWLASSIRCQSSSFAELGFALIGFTRLGVAFLHLRKEEPKETISVLSSLEKLELSRSIIQGRSIAAHLMPFYQRRAIPNKRLAVSFDIDNAFTSSDPQHCGEFVKSARQLLDGIVPVLPKLMDQARSVSKASSDVLRAGKSSPFAPFVRLLAFYVMVPLMFPHIPLNHDFDEGLLITSAINDQWIASKNDSKPPQHKIEALRNSLQHMMPSLRIDGPRDNPLNLILPSYETMWRAVMLCFLEVTRPRSDDAHLAYIQKLENFGRDPSSDNFSHISDDLSVEYIVKESFRLYPPTKTVYRAIPRQRQWPLQKIASFYNMAADNVQQVDIQQVDTQQVDIQQVDIQAIHRDPAYWGEDAMLFNPKRWAKCNDQEREPMNKAFLAFSVTPHRCPAARVGPMLIAVMVAAMVETLGAAYDISGVEQSEDGLLKTGRGDWENVVIGSKSV